MDPLEAYDKLEAFAADYGPLPLRLAMHAAVPQGFRLDMLHLLKLNFLPEATGDHTVEADVILSGVCEDIDDGFFEFDPEIRRQLLDSLVDAYAHEPESRVWRVANFLLAYANQAGRSPYHAPNRLWQDYLEIQRWVALSFCAPAEAAGAFAAALEQAEAENDAPVKVQLGSLAAVLSIPLVHHDKLLTYAEGLQALTEGRYHQAETLLDRLGDEEIVVGETTLRSPTEVLRAWRGRRGVTQPPITGSVDATSEKTSAPAHEELETGQPVDPAVLQTFNFRLATNLGILNDRTAAYDNNQTPPELINRIQAYLQAMKLVKQAKTQKPPAAALQAHLETLDLNIAFDLTKKYYDNFNDYDSAEEILEILHRNLKILEERKVQYDPLDLPLELLNRIYDYRQAIAVVRRRIQQNRSLEDIKALLTQRNYDVSSFVADTAQAPPMTTTPPFQSPSLPEYYVPRVSMMELLKRHLLLDEASSTEPVAIIGRRGIGKTVLAAALAHDEEVRRQFPDGILWATLGETPDLPAILRNWIQALRHAIHTDDRDATVYAEQGAQVVISEEAAAMAAIDPATIKAARDDLQNLLQGRAMLLILDDVRRVDHAQSLFVDSLPCRTLLTSREAALSEALGSQTYQLPLMSERKALEFIETLLGRELQDWEQEIFASFVGVMPALPLALVRAGELIRRGMSGRDLLEALQRELPSPDETPFDDPRYIDQVLSALEAIGASWLAGGEATQRFLIDPRLEQARILFVEQDILFELSEFGDTKEIIIGRASRNRKVDIDLRPYGAVQAGVSRQHAKLTFGEDGWRIQDMRSSSGTSVNDRRTDPEIPVRLSHNDRFRCGRFNFVFLLEA